MTYFLLFLFGLGIGSFLNVVSLRYLPAGRHGAEGGRLLDLGVIGGRSHCRSCSRQLRWYDLLPILSFLWLRGKCRMCGDRILWQYPIVELLSGIIFAAVPYHIVHFQFSIFNFQPLLNSPLLNFSFTQLLFIICWILVFELFLLLSVIDFRLYIIPNQINALLVLLGVVITFLGMRLGLFGEFTGSFISHYAALFGMRESIWINHVIAALGAGLFFTLIIFITRGRGMGWGDVKLIVPLGLLFGWPDIALIIALSFVVGSLFVLPLLFRHTKTMKDIIPFGPFIIIAATLVFFFGYEIMRGYFGLFGIS